MNDTSVHSVAQSSQERSKSSAVEAIEGVKPDSRESCYLDSVINYLSEHYPLVKVIGSADHRLIYDARAHFACCISDEQLVHLVELLRDNKQPQEMSLGYSEDVASQLVAQGLFRPGGLAKRTQTVSTEIQRQVDAFETEVLTRRLTLEVSEKCNFRCRYCPYSNSQSIRKHSGRTMSFSVARKAIRNYFDRYKHQWERLDAPGRRRMAETVPPCIGWYGGEPFLAFDLIAKTKRYMAELPWADLGVGVNSIDYMVNSNLSILTDEILEFLVRNRVWLTVSIDGPEEEHDRNRVFANGRGTFNTVINNLRRLKKTYPEYLRDRVLINAVYARNHSYNACKEFFEAEADEVTPPFGCLGLTVRPESVTGEAVADPIRLLKALRTRENTEVSLFRQSLEPLTPETLMLRMRRDPYFQSEVMSLDKFRKVSTTLYDVRLGANPDELSSSPMCPMGFDLPMVSVNGDYHMCTRTDESMSLGNCDRGLDKARIRDSIQAFNIIHDRKECRECWAIRFCGYCPAMILGGGEYHAPSREACDCQRLRYEMEFEKFFALSKRKELLRVTSLEKRDPLATQGIVRISDLQEQVSRQ